MKLLNAIAAAAVFGASFITINPVKANGWIYSGENTKGSALWVRSRGCSGTICNFQAKVSDIDGVDNLKADCVGRKWKRVGENNWNDLYPQSLLDAGVNKVCS